MKSYIKLYGPPVGEALKALRKVAIDFPEVCIMDPVIGADLGVGTVTGPGGIPGSGGQGRSHESVDMVMSYFGGPSEISEERCDSIISKSGESVGKYDFYFEWFKKPTVSQIEALIEKIDEALAPLGVRYTITSK
jgi:hypothetical protein